MSDLMTIVGGNALKRKKLSQCSSVVTAQEGHIIYYVVKGQRVFHVVEFIEVVNPLIKRQIPVCLRCCEAKPLGKITYQRDDE